MHNVKYMKYITKHDVKHMPNAIFVFGDNDARSGLGGQAREMRGEPNAIGVRVKKSPSMAPTSFYRDEEYYTNINKIAEDLLRLHQMSQGKTIIFPEDGIGTGMAMLDQTAPMTFNYLSERLNSVFGIKNGSGERLAKIRTDLAKVPIDKERIPRKDEFIHMGDYVQFGMGLVQKTGTVVDTYTDDEGKINKYLIKDDDGKVHVVDKSSKIKKAFQLRKRHTMYKVKSKRKVIKRKPVTRCKCKTIKRRK